MRTSVCSPSPGSQESTDDTEPLRTQENGWSWPHAVGQHGEAVKTWIENERGSEYVVRLVGPGPGYDAVSVENRVVVRTNMHGIVVEVPRVG